VQKFEQIVIRYVNPRLNIGLQDVRNAWLLSEKPVKLITTIHQGSLVYRLPGSRKRISYRVLKKNLTKKEIIIYEPLFVMPF
jgi:hypothetical protein